MAERVGAGSAITLPGTTVPLLERPVADVRMVNADYFRTWGIPLKAGRVFAEADGDRPVTLVSEYTAAHVWPGQNPLGQRFRLKASVDISGFSPTNQVISEHFRPMA